MVIDLSLLLFAVMLFSRHLYPKRLSVSPVPWHQRIANWTRLTCFNLDPFSHNSVTNADNNLWNWSSLEQACFSLCSCKTGCNVTSWGKSNPSMSSILSKGLMLPLIQGKYNFFLHLSLDPIRLLLCLTMSLSRRSLAVIHCESWVVSANVPIDMTFSTFFQPHPLDNTKLRFRLSNSTNYCRDPSPQLSLRAPLFSSCNHWAQSGTWLDTIINRQIEWKGKKRILS